MDRPSYKEINSKIKKEKEAVSDNQFSILNPFIIAADALELGVNLERISSILIDLLEEWHPPITRDNIHRNDLTSMILKVASFWRFAG